MTPAVLTLSKLPPGQVARLPSGGFSPELGAELGSENSELLRAMGLRPNASVQLCRLGDPCIVQIGHTRGDSCRLGLSRRLADRIDVCIAPEAIASTVRA